MVCAHSLISFVFSFTSSAHALRLKTFESFHSIHGHLDVSGSPRLDSPFLFAALPSAPFFFFLQFLKFVVNLHNSANDSMDSTDEFSLSTGYEPKAHDLYETSVEPHMQLLNSPPLFSDKISTTMTQHSKTCSTKHIERKPVTLYEKTCLSVCVVVVNVR